MKKMRKNLLTSLALTISVILAGCTRVDESYTAETNISINNAVYSQTEVSPTLKTDEITNLPSEIETSIDITNSVTSKVETSVDNILEL